MTREERGFTVALLISLGAHAFFTGLFFSLPEKDPEEKVVVYTVRILEVQARPKAQRLALSTSAISALRLQSPTLGVNLRPGGKPLPPEPPDAELIPRPGRSLKGTPFKELPVPKAGPSLLPPPTKTGKSVRRDFRIPVPEGVKARPKDALPGSRSVFPKLPERLRPSPPLSSSAPRPGRTRPVSRRPTPPPLPPARSPGRKPLAKSLMERVKERVQTLKLDIEAAPPSRKKAPISPSAGERNLVLVRRYSNSVAKAVKKDYNFPGSGGFKSNLRARLRLAINRDGSVRSIVILESSGNRTFDQIVCRSKIFKAKMPPLPEGISDDPLVLMITCKP